MNTLSPTHKKLITELSKKKHLQPDNFLLMLLLDEYQRTFKRSYPLWIPIRSHMETLPQVLQRTWRKISMRLLLHFVRSGTATERCVLGTGARRSKTYWICWINPPEGALLLHWCDLPYPASTTDNGETRQNSRRLERCGAELKKNWRLLWRQSPTRKWRCTTEVSFQQ